MSGMGHNLNLLALFVSMLVSNAAHEYPCQELYPLLSAKTSYSTVHGNDSFKFKDCEAVSLWILVSVPAHNPNVEEINIFKQMAVLRNTIIENHDRFWSSELCKAEINSFRNWKFNVNYDQAMSISEEGYDELFELGQRLQVRTTSNKLSSMSAIALLKGISFHEQVDPIVIDELLMNEVNCTAWSTSTHSNKLKKETDLFFDSPEARKILIDVYHRLGFMRPPTFEWCGGRTSQLMLIPAFTLGLSSYIFGSQTLGSTNLVSLLNVNSGHIKLMYSLCGYETSWEPTRKSPWCATLTEENLKVLEYFRDLTYYYKSGYGNVLTEKLGCALLGDLITKLIKEEAVTFNFGDTMAIRKLLVTLEIASQDEPLRGDGYNTARGREWRTSLLTPTSANILAVLYKCAGDPGSTKNSYVVFFVNENLVRVPACNGYMCTLDEFLRIFVPISDPKVCNRDFCDQ